MRRVKKVAVLGSGIMGTGIACHLVNAGLDVVMLDIVPFDLPPDKADDVHIRNSIAQKSLKAALKAKPAPLFSNDLAQKITVGNFDDHLSWVADCDWIIEVIVERLDIKRQLFEKIEKYRKPGTLISSNTSGIPIHMMAEGRSEDFQKHFCGTHFFNPPRYLELFEVIPSKYTDPEIVDFFMRFADKILGKTTVKCKDTPAFIGNRVGVFAMGHIYQTATKLGLTIQEVDKLTGPAIARPNTGTFRLSDLVGLDVAGKVIAGIKQNCPDDDMAQQLQMPKFLTYLIENKFLGNKTGQGFYKKTNERNEKGKRLVLGLNLETLEYEPPKRSELQSLKLSKQIDNPQKRIKALFNHEDKGGQLIKESLAALFAYVSHRIPEISDDIVNLDNALKAGFAWGFGPFETWDIVGIEEGIRAAEEYGYSIADWVKSMVSNGANSFYKTENGQALYYDKQTSNYKSVPGAEEKIILKRLEGQSPVYKNDEIVVHDIGDGVLCLEFKSKSNAIGEGILQGLQETIQLAEDGEWNGLVIGNNAKNFSVGANLMMIGMLAFQQDFDQLNMAVELFQNSVMRCRHSKIPVVAATQGYVFGGSCEIAMHCDSTQLAAESYVGLVEVGVGLLPGGGGTKEFAVRASDEFFEGDIKIPTLLERFKTIAMASVATSAKEAFGHGYMSAKDEIVMHKARNIKAAKDKVLELADGYIMPSRRNDIMVLGRDGLGALYTAAHSLKLGKYASEHDVKIAKKVAYVLCGGDLSSPQKVSDQYLLDIEREAFMSLCGEQKTMERIQYMLENNKPLRN